MRATLFGDLTCPVYMSEEARVVYIAYRTGRNRLAEEKTTFTWLAITPIYIDHPVPPRILFFAERDYMQLEHEQIIGMEQSVWTHLRPPYRYRYISGVTANHRTPADIAVIFSGESRR
jgi:hypothetical protein